MKKLYRVEAFWYTLAESESEAEAIKPDMDGIDLEVSPAGLSGMSRLWRRSFPFGGKGDRTCEQILNEGG